MQINWTSSRVAAQGFVAPGFEPVAAEFERARQLAPHPATPHNDYVHGVSSHCHLLGRPAGCYDRAHAPGTPFPERPGPDGMLAAVHCAGGPRRTNECSKR